MDKFEKVGLLHPPSLSPPRPAWRQKVNNYFKKAEKVNKLLLELAYSRHALSIILFQFRLLFATLIGMSAVNLQLFLGTIFIKKCFLAISLLSWHYTYMDRTTIDRL